MFVISIIFLALIVIGIITLAVNAIWLHYEPWGLLVIMIAGICYVFADAIANIVTAASGQ